MIAAIARDDSEEPRMASRVDRRAWDRWETDESVVDDKWNDAAAKNDADVTV